MENNYDDTIEKIYSTPFVALSIARELMQQKFDVLLVIDDLKKYNDVCNCLINGNTYNPYYPDNLNTVYNKLFTQNEYSTDKVSITMVSILDENDKNIIDYIPTNIISLFNNYITISNEIKKSSLYPVLDVLKSRSDFMNNVNIDKRHMELANLCLKYLYYYDKLEKFELEEDKFKSIKLRNYIYNQSLEEYRENNSLENILNNVENILNNNYKNTNSILIVKEDKGDKVEKV